MTVAPRCGRLYHIALYRDLDLADILPIETAMPKALELLEAGQAIALPTETVYGLAADATRGDAVARIFEAKGRPRFNPLIVHVSDLAAAEAIATFDDAALLLARAFWPGPLTLVLPLKAQAGIHPLVTAGLETVALRMPQGPMREVIARLGRPLAAPSANMSGRVSGTTAAAVAADLGDRIALVVDGGPTRVGVESTIVKLDHGRLTLLRPGGVTIEELEAVAGVPVERSHGGAIEAPGMLSSHYAPQAGVRLDARQVKPGEALLAFGPERIAGAQEATAMVNLSPLGDLREAAANLFSALLELDRAAAATIAVEPIPRHGLGEAINDRLARAAAPRTPPNSTI